MNDDLQNKTKDQLVSEVQHYEELLDEISEIIEQTTDKPECLLKIVDAIIRFGYG